MELKEPGILVFAASKVSCCCKMVTGRWQRPRNTFGKRSIGRAGKTPCPGNCAPLRAWPSFCVTKIPRTRWHVSSRSTLGSARASHSRPQEARALLDALP